MYCAQRFCILSVVFLVNVYTAYGRSQKWLCTMGVWGFSYSQYTAAYDSACYWTLFDFCTCWPGSSSEVVSGCEHTHIYTCKNSVYLSFYHIISTSYLFFCLNQHFTHSPLATPSLGFSPFFMSFRSVLCQSCYAIESSNSETALLSIFNESHLCFHFLLSFFSSHVRF